MWYNGCYVNNSPILVLTTGSWLINKSELLLEVRICSYCLLKLQGLLVRDDYVSFATNGWPEHLSPQLLKKIVDVHLEVVVLCYSKL